MSGPIRKEYYYLCTWSGPQGTMYIDQTNQTTMNNEINFATATHEELMAAGFIVKVRPSQMKTRRSTKSVWGVKPTINKAHGVYTIANAPENATSGKLRG